MLYDINNYEGKPRVYLYGHDAELRQVSKPIPGDVAQDFDYSHVAIVKDVSGSEVTLIEQNWKWNDWATGDLVCTVNRKITTSDYYFYRLYIDGEAQTLDTPVPTLTASASSITRDGFTVKAKATDDGGIAKFRIGTYPKSLGSSAIKWKTVTKSGPLSSSTSVAVKTSDFGDLEDTYVTKVEVYNTSGVKKTKTINTVVSRTAPTISSVMISGKSSTGYTVTCVVKGTGSIKSVKFPTWTSAGATDDLSTTWTTGTDCDGKISGETVSFTVKTSDHNKELGEYNTYIYAYDSFGNMSSKGVQVNIQRPLSELTFGSISNQSYTGKALKPSITVKDGSRKLTVNKDYKLTYSNNIAVGKASVKVTGMGNYSGTKTLYFKVVPAKVTGLKEVKATAETIDLSWNKNSNAACYYIYRKDGTSWKKIGSTSSASYTVKSLSVGSNYEFMVRAFRSVNGTDYLSNYSDTLSAVTKAGDVKNLKFTKSGKTFNLSWDKVSRSDGYMVEVSTDGKTFSRAAVISKASTVKYALAAGKSKMYVKVRAFKLLGNTHYYGKYSNMIQVK